MDKRLSSLGSWLYQKLSSVRVSIYLLALLLPFYILGTIFPQGFEVELYENAGGEFVTAVRLFDLLNIFSSPWFLIPAFVLFLNLAVCAYERLLNLLSRKRPLPVTFIPEFTIPLDPAVDETRIERVLAERLGFRDVPSSEGREGSAWKVKEKGFSYRWLTWLYHFGILLCFVGFLLTGLFVIEGVITLNPGEPTSVVSTEDEHLGWLRKEDHSAAQFKLTLDEFITEYTELPHLDYPTDKISRLAVALGWKDLSYTIKTESLFPKDWKSALRVIKGGVSVYEKTIEVNDPLRFEGYTFYQLGYEQNLKIGIDKNPLLLEVKSGEELEVPGIEGTFKFGTFRTGTLFRLDGSVEKLTPFVMVRRRVKDGEEEREEELGKLEMGGFITVGGRRIRFAEAEESSILSYRYDPGVPILWWAGVLVFAVMSLRCFGRWYMLAYRIEEAGGARDLLLSISTKGLSADPEKLKKRIEHYLSGP
jgi:cytochrome c biogenesis protein ResB